MNGLWLGTRAIRASPMNTTVYVGNLAPETTDPELAKVFGKYGIMEK